MCVHNLLIISGWPYGKQVSFHPSSSDIMRDNPKIITGCGCVSDFEGGGTDFAQIQREGVPRLGSAIAGGCRGHPDVVTMKPQIIPPSPNDFWAVPKLSHLAIF